MNSENVKNNDPLQLQQMVIFLKAELAKYKYEVKKYQDSYHYSLAEKLEQENVQLTNDNKELSEELYKLKQEFEQRTSDYKVSIHLQEMEKEKYIASIDNLRKTKTDLRPINKQLTEVIKKMKDGVNTNQYWYLKHDKQVTSFHKRLGDNKTSLEQLEYKLVDHIQEANKQVHSQLEKLDIANKERTQSEKVRQRLLIEIEEKNNAIGKLQHEISNLKEQNGKYSEAIAIEEKNQTNKMTIEQLENMLVDFIQEENKQVHFQLEKLDIANKERTQFEKMRQRFLIEIEEKNNAIGKLQHEISNLKEQNGKYSEAIAIEEKNLTNNTIIEQLEYKFVNLIQEENKQVHSQLEKLAIANKERTQSEKVRQRFLIEIKEKNTTIEKLQHEISDLKEQNEKHSEAIAIEEKNQTNKTTIEQLEYKLVDLIQEENKQVHSQLEKLAIANKERTQSEKVRQRLLIEIEEKNTTIGKLQHEISDLKKQNEKHSEAFTMLEKNLNQKNDSQAGIDSFSSTTTPTIDTETLIQLDHQIKEIVAKSLDYEEKLDAKLLVVNTLEKKLDQLTDEIDGIKIFSVEGRVLKEF